MFWLWVLWLLSQQVRCCLPWNSGLNLYFSSFCSGISVWATREEGTVFLMACEWKVLITDFQLDRKMPTLRATAPVGNTASLVSHWIFLSPLNNSIILPFGVSKNCWTSGKLGRLWSETAVCWNLYFSSFCSGISVWATREEGTVFLMACEWKVLITDFRLDRKMPTLRATAPVGNTVSLVSLRILLSPLNNSIILPFGVSKNWQSRKTLIRNWIMLREDFSGIWSGCSGLRYLP